MAVRLPITQSASFAGGASDYADFGDRTDLDGVAQATWSIWLYYPSSVDIANVLFGRWQGSGVSAGGWHINNSGSNLLLFLDDGSLAEYVNTTSSFLLPDTWYHVVFTYDAGTIAAYANGVAQAVGAGGVVSKTTIPAPGIATELQISRPGGASTLYTGYVSNAAYWAGTAATPTQVAEIYESGRVHDLAFMATMPTPDFWAPLDGDLSILGGGMGTSSGVSYVSEIPPLVPGGATLVYASEYAEGSLGSASAGSVPYGAAPAVDLPVGAPVVSDWCSTGTGWLLSQFYGKPKMEAILCALLGEGQTLEQAFADLRDISGLPNARGVILDAVGQAVGLPRNSLPDATISDDGYRNLLRGAAAAKAAQGDPNGMIRTALTILSGASGVVYSESYPAGAYLAATGALSYSEGKAIARIVRRARPAGVGYSFSYLPSVPGARVLVHDDHPSLPVYDIPEDGDSDPLLPEEDSGA